MLPAFMLIADELDRSGLRTLSRVDGDVKPLFVVPPFDRDANRCQNKPGIGEIGTRDGGGLVDQEVVDHCSRPGALDALPRGPRERKSLDNKGRSRSRTDVIDEPDASRTGSVFDA